MSSIPSLSASMPVSVNPLSERSLLPSLSESVSRKSKVPSLSVSSGVSKLPPVNAVPSSASTFTVRPSLSASVLSTA